MQRPRRWALPFRGECKEHLKLSKGRFLSLHGIQILEHQRLTVGLEVDKLNAHLKPRLRFSSRPRLTVLYHPSRLDRAGGNPEDEVVFVVELQWMFDGEKPPP